MKSATLFSWIVIVFVTVAVVAQTSTSQNNQSPNFGLKITGFNFEAKSSSRLDVVPVQPSGSGTLPTAPANYGAEYSGAPTRNSQYYQYEKRTEVTRYATLRVKNEGLKAIRSVVWVFTDPHFKGDKEVGYSEAKTKMNIPSGQSAVLVQRVPEHRNCGQAMSVASGTYSIAGSCGRPNRKITSYYTVEAKLKQVMYSDGSVWNAH